MIKNNKNDEEQRYLDMISNVHDYMHNVESKMCETEILYYVAKELGVSEQLEQYDCKNSIFEKLGISIKEELFYDVIEDEINNSSNERKVYLTVRKIMINNLFLDKPIDLYRLINNKKSNSKQIKKISKKY